LKELAFEFKAATYKLFNVSTCRIVFIEDDQFVFYGADESIVKQDSSLGICGHVRRTMKPLIVSDV